jgi:saccharopine dehydrogenase-like NADP-dependent oxidoreductase
MNKKTVLILGGYGSTGLPLASLLLAETDVLLVLAGRSGEKAKEAAASLNGLFEGERVAGIHADASNSLSLRQAFEGVDIVVVASSTARYASTVARAAIRGGLDYLDIQVSSAKLAALRTLEEEINRAGRCFITEAGLHTGLTATLVRAVAPRFDRLERANVGTIMKLDWASLTFTRSTMNEFVEGFLEFEPLVFCDGS